MSYTRNVKYLTIILLFRLLFGGYIAGMDQFLFKDPESARTVVMIHGLIGALFSLYLMGRSSGIRALMYLEAVYLFANLLYSALSILKVIEPGLHDPLSNIWLTIVQIAFSALTLYITVLINRGIN